MASSITYYPVGNGDQSLIRVEENNYITNILVDCRIRESCIGDENADQFDVKADLLKRLNKRKVNEVNDVPYTDNFILTHGDDDHLHGFERHFYQGDPKTYKEKNKKDGEILIDVLWFSPMVMGTATNEDEKIFNKEAKRRIKLHQEKSSDKDLPGNRIVIIGKDTNEDLSGLSLVRKVPGDIVTRFNDRDLKTFSIFIHSPYQDQLSDEEVDKNRVSLVFQARFKSSSTATDFSALAMFGGDANYEAWSQILKKTKKYKNDTKEQALKWDLFMACHHCSWTFFNDTPQEDHPDPLETSLEVLDNKRNNAYVIASSKEIKNDEDNPPHYNAKEEYIEKVGSGKFLCTATDSIKDKTAQPITFEITEEGIKKVESESEKEAKRLTAAISVASSSIIKKPWAY